MSVGDDSHFAFLKREDQGNRGETYLCLRKMRIYCAEVSLRLRLRSEGFAFHELFQTENLASASLRLIYDICAERAAPIDLCKPLKRALEFIALIIRCRKETLFFLYHRSF